ncbi:MAG: GDSL-type esterase/lipase family protein, partial [Lysinibacillus sp.]
MQFSKKFRFLAASILALQFTVPVMAGAEESTVVDDVAPSWSAQADYVALGDSLAHGMNEVGAIGLGYTDFVAQTLRKEGFIRSYNKGFAYSGYTTVNVLADLKADVQKKITGFGYGSENANIRSGVKDAEIVTLTVGANDILPLLEQSTSINTSVILAASKKAMENTAAILAEIKMLNPKAQVFVMGYYNSFTYKSEQEQTQFKTLLGLMNSSIKTTAEKAGAIFVPTADIVAANVPDYLPNPENIHLSEAGYQAVAQQAFLPTIKKSALWDNTSAIKVGQVTPTTAHVEWDAATDNVGIAKYNVYVNHQLHKTLSADETVMTLEKLASSTSYTVAVKAVDAAGNESTQSPSASFTTGGTANFTDTKDHWAKDFINQAVASGMMKGYPHDTFKPNQALTRAQAASILVRSLGLSTDEKA